MPRYSARNGSRGNGDGGIILEEKFITKLDLFMSDEGLGGGATGQFPFVRAGVALIEAVKEYGRNVDAVRRGVDGVHATLTECKSAREAEEKSRKRRKRKRRRSTSSTASVESKKDGDNDGLDCLTPVVIKVCFLELLLILQ